MDNLSPNLRQYIINEFRRVAQAIRAVEGPNRLNDAVYFYSAVYGACSRILNIEYSADACLLHNVTQIAHAALNERITTAPLDLFPEAALIRYAEYTDAMADEIETVGHVGLATLAAISAAAYAMGGNGFYLYRARGVGL